MSRARTYARNLIANWSGYVAGVAVLLFVSPYVVHSLGVVRYGVWTTLMSLTGYMSLVELGTQAGLGRYLNHYLGRKDFDKVNGVLNTALAMFGVAGFLLLAVSGALAMLLGSIFPRIPAALLDEARTVLPLVALNLWLTFIGAAFRQLMTAHERFDLANLLEFGVLALRTAGTVAVLSAGYGLVPLAWVAVGATAAGVLGAGVVAGRLFRPMRLRPRLVSRERFRELFGFSIWAFVSNIAMRLLYMTDTLVIAVLLGPASVTVYSIGARLLIYAKDLLGKVSAIFGPKMMQDCAREDRESLRWTYRRGANLVMSVGVGLLIGMIVFGKEFIVLWMGPEFEASYPVLAILTSSQFAAAAVLIASPVYFGLNRVKISASLTLLQGVLNLGLTLLFVMAFDMGIYGVAWGTFYPRIVFALLAGALAMRWIGLSGWRFLTSSVSRWALAGGAFLGVCHGVRHGAEVLGWTGGWGFFVLKAAVAAGLYLPLAWMILLDAADRRRLGRAMMNRLPWRRPSDADAIPDSMDAARRAES